MNNDLLVSAREKLLTEIVNYFSSDPAVNGVFLGGSLPAGTADHFSDIDLRVVVTPEEHDRFVASRKDMPKHWSGFLFNEWMEGAQHCVSHFRPFLKVDIFYHSQADLRPSPWYSLPTTILYDPVGFVSGIIESSQPFKFETNKRRVDWLLSKGLATAHEVYRRSRRGELLYAQNLLEEFRSYVAEADDWILQRVPPNPPNIKFERRLDPPLLEALMQSYVVSDPKAIETALLDLLTLFREQLIELHKMYDLSRPLENDLYAISILQDA
jgi:hypothetical protein